MLMKSTEISQRLPKASRLVQLED